MHCRMRLESGRGLSKDGIKYSFQMCSLCCIVVCPLCGYEERDKFSVFFSYYPVLKEVLYFFLCHLESFVWCMGWIRGEKEETEPKMLYLFKAIIIYTFMGLVNVKRSWHEKSIVPLLGESNAIHHVQVPCSSECFKFLPSFPSEELKFLKSLCLWVDQE